MSLNIENIDQTKVFKINLDSREIIIPTFYKGNPIAVYGDNNSNILYFKIFNNYQNIFTISESQIKIQYKNAIDNQYYYEVDMANSFIDADNYFYFAWPISATVTEGSGTIAFNIRFQIAGSEEPEAGTQFLNTQTQFLTVKESLILSKPFAEIQNYIDINNNSYIGSIFDLPDDLTFSFWEYKSIALNINNPQDVYLINLNSRTIIDPPKSIGVEYDHNSNIIYFKCPRYYNDYDLTSGACLIQYINAQGEPGFFAVPYYDIINENEAGKTDKNKYYILFPWVIDGIAARVEGRVVYNIRFYQIINNNNINNKLLTEEDKQIQENINKQIIANQASLLNNWWCVDAAGYQEFVDIDAPSNETKKYFSFNSIINFTIAFKNIYLNEKTFFGFNLGSSNSCTIGYDFNSKKFGIQSGNTMNTEVFNLNLKNPPDSLIIESSDQTFNIELNKIYHISFIISNEYLSIKVDDQIVFNTENFKRSDNDYIIFYPRFLDMDIQKIEWKKGNNDFLTIVENSKLKPNDYLNLDTKADEYDYGHILTYLERQNMLDNQFASLSYLGKQALQQEETSINILKNILELLANSTITQEEASAAFQYIHLINNKENIIQINALYYALPNSIKEIIKPYKKFLKDEDFYNLEIQPAQADIYSGLKLNMQDIDEFYGGVNNVTQTIQQVIQNNQSIITQWTDLSQ